MAALTKLKRLARVLFARSGPRGDRAEAMERQTSAARARLAAATEGKARAAEFLLEQMSGSRSAIHSHR